MMFSKVCHEASKVCKTFSQKDNFPTAKKMKEVTANMTMGSKESTSILIFGITRRTYYSREALLFNQK